MFPFKIFSSLSNYIFELTPEKLSIVVYIIKTRNAKSVTKPILPSLIMSLIF